MEKVGYNMRHGTTTKNGRLRMDRDMHVFPLPVSKKPLIIEATADEPQGMAAWARAVLLDAAKRKLTKNGNRESAT
jgi:hypothetical protein